MPFAIDTNIAIYALVGSERRVAALRLIEEGPHISVQLLNEFANVAINKFRKSWIETGQALELIESAARSIRAIDVEVNHRAQHIAKRYALSFYDSLMLSAARLDRCTTFYSEDLQHGLVIDDQLTILNPFLSEQEPA